MKKKLLAVCALALVSVLCVALVACNNDENSTEAASFVSLDINPSVELTLDKNNNVLSVYAANEDAQVLLYGENDIVGMTVEEAVDKITSLAIELGYINEDNEVVQTSVTAVNGSDALLEKVNAQISATATKLNASISVSGADAYSLLRKLEQVKAQYPDNQKIQALTPDQFKLVISASESGNITVEAAVELNTKDLINAVSSAHETAEAYATEAYEKAKVEAQNAYDKALGLVTDGIYTTYYTFNHPSKAYYGLAYQGYKTTARGLNALASVLEFAEDLAVQPIDDAKANDIATLLGATVDDLKNADGEVTLKSIEAYADKKFKNSEAGEQLEKLKADLGEALDSLESEIKAKIDELSQQYAPQITIIANSMSTVIDGIKQLEAIIPEPYLTQIRTLRQDLTDVAQETLNIISDLKITSLELRTLADTLFEKSDAALRQIETDLTAEELEEIAELQQQAIDGISNAKTQMDEAIANAKQAAKDYLEQIKNERKQTEA